jgi:hypothetical protein
VRRVSLHQGRRNPLDLIANVLPKSDRVILLDPPVSLRHPFDRDIYPPEGGDYGTHHLDG